MKKTLSSIACDPLTEEQLKKRTSVEENVDIKGVVKRRRVVDQTVWDIMFLYELIDQPQHEALNLFLDDLTKSGAFPSGARLDKDPVESTRSPSDVHAERRMAFSSAFRAMVRESSEEKANLVINMFSSNVIYRNSKVTEEEMKRLKDGARQIDRALWSLAKHYRTMGRRDPRRILRAQVGRKVDSLSVSDPYKKKKRGQP